MGPIWARGEAVGRGGGRGRGVCECRSWGQVHEGGLGGLRGRAGEPVYHDGGVGFHVGAAVGADAAESVVAVQAEAGCEAIEPWLSGQLQRWVVVGSAVVGADVGAAGGGAGGQGGGAAAAAAAAGARRCRLQLSAAAVAGLHRLALLRQVLLLLLLRGAVLVAQGLAEKPLCLSVGCAALGSGGGCRFPVPDVPVGGGVEVGYSGVGALVSGLVGVGLIDHGVGCVVAFIGRAELGNQPEAGGGRGGHRWAGWGEGKVLGSVAESVSLGSKLGCRERERCRGGAGGGGCGRLRAAGGWLWAAGGC